MKKDLKNNNALNHNTKTKEDIHPVFPNEEVHYLAMELEKNLSLLRVTGKVIAVHSGPVVTGYEFKTTENHRLRKIQFITDDTIELRLNVYPIRVIQLPDTNHFIFEIPNTKRKFISFDKLLKNKLFQNNKDVLSIVLGQNTRGNPIYADLDKMSNLLIADWSHMETANCLDIIILSLIQKFTPNECQFILINPTHFELNEYREIPHLHTPFVTDKNKVTTTLKNLIKQMVKRKSLFDKLNVQNLQQYNEKVTRIQTDLQPLPHIVIIVDGIDDFVQDTDFIDSIVKLHSLGTMTGFHLIVTTTNLNENVLPQTINDFFLNRICFQTRTGTSSRAILHERGAEKLLFYGDMLLKRPEKAVCRVHMPYLTQEELSQKIQEIHKKYNQLNKEE